MISARSSAGVPGSWVTGPRGTTIPPRLAYPGRGIRAELGHGYGPVVGWGKVRSAIRMSAVQRWIRSEDADKPWRNDEVAG